MGEGKQRKDQTLTLQMTRMTQNQALAARSTTIWADGVKHPPQRREGAKKTTVSS